MAILLCYRPTYFFYFLFHDIFMILLEFRAALCMGYFEVAVAILLVKDQSKVYIIGNLN